MFVYVLISQDGIIHIFQNEDKAEWYLEEFKQISKTHVWIEKHEVK